MRPAAIKNPSPGTRQECTVFRARVLRTPAVQHFEHERRAAVGLPTTSYDGNVIAVNRSEVECRHTRDDIFLFSRDAPYAIFFFCFFLSFVFLERGRAGYSHFSRMYPSRLIRESSLSRRLSALSEIPKLHCDRSCYQAANLKFSSRVVHETALQKSRTSHFFFYER